MSRGSTQTITADIENDFGFKVQTVIEPAPYVIRHNGALKFFVEVGLLPELFLDACLRRAHAMGDVHRRADFVGGRR